MRCMRWGASCLKSCLAVSPRKRPRRPHLEHERQVVSGKPPLHDLLYNASAARSKRHTPLPNTLGRCTLLPRSLAAEALASTSRCWACLQASKDWPCAQSGLKLSWQRIPSAGDLHQAPAEGRGTRRNWPSANHRWASSQVALISSLCSNAALRRPRAALAAGWLGARY